MLTNLPLPLLERAHEADDKMARDRNDWHWYNDSVEELGLQTPQHQDTGNKTEEAVDKAERQVEQLTGEPFGIAVEAFLQDARRVDVEKFHVLAHHVGHDLIADF
jgi:hypothetical protein